ncbi:LapA family protein [Limisalsivibrio acetivorans]|uniref:LapA family protein n=1 Tax=Limisalsivibrio acetivorans TaxID=1304888 RepID=UPI0003B6F496|nr:LapA family protein [Limisalsivibrio acetivorans]
MKFIGNLLKIAMVIAIVLFAVMNNQVVSVQYFYETPSREVPLFVVMLVSLCVGIVIASIFYLFDRFKLTSQLRNCRKQLKTAEGEIKRLRNLPLMSDEKEEGGEKK